MVVVCVCVCVGIICAYICVRGWVSFCVCVCVREREREDLRVCEGGDCVCGGLAVISLLRMLLLPRHLTRLDNVS